MNILSFLIRHRTHRKQITKLPITKDIGTTIANLLDYKTTTDNISKIISDNLYLLY